MGSSRPPLYLSVLFLLLFVSCRGGDSEAKLFQQITVLSEEVRTTNAELKLLRQEVGNLRKELAAQTGISPEAATSKASGSQPAACPLPNLEAGSSTEVRPADRVVGPGQPEPPSQQSP